MGLISSVLNSIDDFDPSYVKSKNEVKEKIFSLEQASVAMVVASVALAILGVAALAAGSTFAAPVILIVALPMFYFGYNAYQVCQNTKRVADNPREIVSCWGMGSPDPMMFRNELLKNTFGFEWLIDKMIREVCYENSQELGYDD